jgi:hypothetical protein
VAAQEGHEHRADMKFLVTKATVSPSQKNNSLFCSVLSAKIG